MLSLMEFKELAAPGSCSPTGLGTSAYLAGEKNCEVVASAKATTWINHKGPPNTTLPHPSQLIQWQALTQCSGLTSRHTGSSWAHPSVA